MSFLVLFARKLSLKNQVNDLNFKLMQKTQELQDLQSYTAAIADGEVSMNDLTTSPVSMFGRMSQYMVGSHNYAMTAAQQNMAVLQGQPQPQAQEGQDAQQQAQAQAYYQQLVFKNLYDQQKAQYLKAEQAQLHVKEKAMENEKLKLEQQLKMAEAELSQMDQAINNGIKEAAPQYA